MIMKKNTEVIVLAAGKGERMKSSLPKVLHKVCSRPMILYVFDLVKALGIKKCITVTGFGHNLVRAVLGAKARTVVQKKLLGTADAVKQGLSALGNAPAAVLILYGDIPLLKKETLQKLIAYHYENGCDATVLTATVEKPAGYGRILRDKYSSICGIVEEKDADDFQKEIKEINTGIIIFKKSSLKKALGLIKKNAAKNEYYLTDSIGIFYKNGFRLEAVKADDAQEALGINSRVELAVANKIMRKRINRSMMEQGVTVVDPDSTFISHGSKIGQDTVIYPFTVIESDCIIGKHCFIGPFAHLREGTRIEDNVLIGNFIETARASISSQTLVKHFGYIGDAKIGSAVNIGAGSVTANFDGARKHMTVIGDGAFIGSDTVLVAPVRVGKRAKTGAGSVVVKNQDIPDGEVVVGVPARAIKIKG